MKSSDETVLSKKPSEIIAYKKERLRRKTIFSRTIFLLFLYTILLLLLCLVFGAAQVNRTSLLPTLKENDIVIIQKCWNSYKRGDLVVYKDTDGKRIIKRIVALPGETVDITENGDVMINGVILEEEYCIGRTYPSNCGVSFPYEVGNNAFFLLGDNRENSVDSRDKGAVNISRIIGKVLFSLEKHT